MLLRQRPFEEGFTLVEIIIGVTIVAIAVVGIVAGLSAVISTSSLHRRQATAQTILVSAAESIKRQGYNECATPAYKPTEEVNLYPPPTSTVTWNVQIVTPVKFWDEATNAWTTTCTNGAKQLQLITLQIVEDGEAKSQEKTSVVKRAN